jgi:hypothetical protein
VVLAMAVTSEVDRGAPVDRVEARDGGMARPVIGCGAAGGRVLHARGRAHGEGKGTVWRRMHGDASIARCECNGEEHTYWVVCGAGP